MSKRRPTHGLTGRIFNIRSIGKRLLALEGGPRGQFDDLSDSEIAERLNEIYAQLRPFGYDNTEIDPGNPDTLELQMMILATTRWLHAEETVSSRFQNTENIIMQSIGDYHAQR